MLIIENANINKQNSRLTKTHVNVLRFGSVAQMAAPEVRHQRAVFFFRVKPQDNLVDEAHYPAETQMAER